MLEPDFGDILLAPEIRLAPPIEPIPPEQAGALHLAGRRDERPAVAERQDLDCLVGVADVTTAGGGDALAAPVPDQRPVGGILEHRQARQMQTAVVAGPAGPVDHQQRLRARRDLIERITRVDVAGQGIDIRPYRGRPAPDDRCRGRKTRDRGGDDLIPGPNPGKMQGEIDGAGAGVDQERRFGRVDERAERAFELLADLPLSDIAAGEHGGDTGGRARLHADAKQVDHRVASSIPASSTLR
jgi:hypothetical protein